MNPFLLKLIGSAAEAVLPQVFETVLKAPAVNDTMTAAHQAKAITEKATAAIAQQIAATPELAPQKPWESRRVWAAVFALISVLAPFVGINLPVEFGDTLMNAAQAAPALLAAGAMLWSVVRPSHKSVALKSPTA